METTEQKLQKTIDDLQAQINLLKEQLEKCAKKEKKGFVEKIKDWMKKKMPDQNEKGVEVKKNKKESSVVRKAISGAVAASILGLVGYSGYKAYTAIDVNSKTTKVKEKSDNKKTVAIKTIQSKNGKTIKVNSDSSQSNFNISNEIKKYDLEQAEKLLNYSSCSVGESIVDTVKDIKIENSRSFNAKELKKYLINNEGFTPHKADNLVANLSVRYPGFESGNTKLTWKTIKEAKFNHGQFKGISYYDHAKQISDKFVLTTKKTSAEKMTKNTVKKNKKIQNFVNNNHEIKINRLTPRQIALEKMRKLQEKHPDVQYRLVKVGSKYKIRWRKVVYERKHISLETKWEKKGFVNGVKNIGGVMYFADKRIADEWVKIHSTDLEPTTTVYGSFGDKIQEKVFTFKVVKNINGWYIEKYKYGRYCGGVPFTEQPGPKLKAFMDSLGKQFIWWTGSNAFAGLIYVHSGNPKTIEKHVQPPKKPTCPTGVKVPPKTGPRPVNPVSHNDSISPAFVKGKSDSISPAFVKGKSDSISPAFVKGKSDTITKATTAAYKVSDTTSTIVIR